MARIARKRGLALGLHIAGMAWNHSSAARLRGGMVAALGVSLAVAMASYNVSDPSFNAVSTTPPVNALGKIGATLADLGLQSFGLAAALAALLMVIFGLFRAVSSDPEQTRDLVRTRATVGTLGLLALAGLLAAPPAPALWPLARGLGGIWGDGVLHGLASLISYARLPFGIWIATLLLALTSGWALGYALGLRRIDLVSTGEWIAHTLRPQPKSIKTAAQVPLAPIQSANPRRSRVDVEDTQPASEVGQIDSSAALPVAIKTPKPAMRESGRELREAQGAFDFVRPGGFALPELSMLAKPKPRAASFDEGALRQNAQLLESVLAEFGVRGQIDQIRPGPVVTLYELVPAPGVKSARVVALSDDIARSMSVAACRVAVVPGRNAIGIELPNARRETVYLRDLLASSEYEKSSQALPMALGENIGGEPYIADLSKMPHLLIAGTTGSGKSVGVNAMILSILYRLSPEQCRFIMIDPKMLELSVYDGIPHLLAPVVTDPKKAIVALKWTVREMEDRYRLMSKIGVRNVASYNERAKEAVAKGEHFERTVQTGFDDAGRPMYESERIDPKAMPYLVVVIDEVADLMMVAGKDVESAVQRLARWRAPPAFTWSWRPSALRWM